MRVQTCCHSPSQGGPSQAVRPMTGSGRPLTGFARPGTSSSGKPGSSSGRMVGAMMSCYVLMWHVRQEERGPPGAKGWVSALGPHACMRLSAFPLGPALQCPSLPRSQRPTLPHHCPIATTGMQGTASLEQSLRAGGAGRPGTSLNRPVTSSGRWDTPFILLLARHPVACGTSSWHTPISTPR